MNNIIEYYYNIKNIDIINIDNNYLIMDNNDFSYLLYEINNNINIKNTINILSNLNNSYYGDLILNNKLSYITKINDKNYVLIRIKGIINELITINDIISNNIKYRVNNNKIINYNELWSKKIDYLEYQISELGNNYNEILYSFSFFIGLAENAISYLNINNINYNNIHMTISHLRIKNNELFIDYYNPLNILIDYDIRDYAEYIKNKLLITDDIDKDIKYILNNAKLSNDDIKLLYARLLFPTFYFDKVEEILIDKNEEKELNKYIDIIPRYINMLKDVYIEINKKGISIDIPNWIIKN